VYVLLCVRQQNRDLCFCCGSSPSLRIEYPTTKLSLWEVANLVMICNWPVNCQRYSSLSDSFRPEEGVDIFLRNVAFNITCTFPYPTSQHFSIYPLYERCNLNRLWDQFLCLLLIFLFSTWSCLVQRYVTWYQTRALASCRTSSAIWTRAVCTVLSHFLSYRQQRAVLFACAHAPVCRMDGHVYRFSPSGRFQIFSQVL
jgi:hypothetical protein